MVKNTSCLNTANCCVSNIQMLTIIPLVLIHEDVTKASLKLFVFSTEEKKLFRKCFE